MPKIGILSNPFANICKRRPHYNTLLREALGDAGTLFVTTDLAQLATACGKLASSRTEVVGVVGGDGSISLVLSQIARSFAGQPLPAILLLRGGTMNVLAANLGINGTPLPLLRRYLDSAVDPRGAKNKGPVATAVDSLRVDGRLGFIFANGQAASFLEDFYRDKRGPAGAAKALSLTMVDSFRSPEKRQRSFLNLEEMAFLPGNEPFHPESAAALPLQSMIFASTIPRLPFGVRLFHDLSLGDGWASCVEIGVSGRELVLQTARLLVGGRMKHPLIRECRFQSGGICMRPGSLYSLDGDVLRTGSGELRVEVGPRFRFLQP